MPHHPASIVRLLYDAHEAEHKPDGSDGMAKFRRRQFVAAANECRRLFVPIKFFVRKPSPFRKVRGVVVNVERSPYLQPDRLHTRRHRLCNSSTLPDGQ